MDSQRSRKVQRSLPFGPLAPRRVLTLAPDHIHPVVRIAHRVRHPLTIPERILFDHELVLILAGAGDLVLGDERCSYQAHDLLFIPPFLPHRFDAATLQAGDHVAVHFDFSADMGELDDDLEQRTPYEVRLVPSFHIPRRQFVPPDSSLEQALLGLVREQDSPDPLAALRTIREMFNVLVSVLAPNEGQSPRSLFSVQARNQARVERVITFIHSSVQMPLDAAALAQIADLSASRMNTVFRQMTGYSPLEYVRRARVSHARRLLADPQLSVKEIAARTGFEDSFHFSRVFRRIDGLSPTHYREAVLASQPTVTAPQMSEADQTSETERIIGTEQISEANRK